MEYDFSKCTFHEGELKVQRAAGVEDQAERLKRMMKPYVTPPEMRFVKSQMFFFMATSNKEGDCDCSFRGRSENDDGTDQPLLQFVSPTHLVIPDFKGNNMLNSIGNIATNPKVGLLFVDFSIGGRFRINGKATLLEDASQFQSLWPKAKRLILVEIEQAYPNCAARIPYLVPGRTR